MLRLWRSLSDKPLGWEVKPLQETSPVAYDTAPKFTMTWMTESPSSWTPKHHHQRPLICSEVTLQCTVTSCRDEFHSILLIWQLSIESWFFYGKIFTDKSHCIPSHLGFASACKMLANWLANVECFINQWLLTSWSYIARLQEIY